MATTLRISSEELALALSLSEHQSLAHDFLVSSFGSGLNQDEIRGKLTAASHTLLSQRLISIAADTTISLSPLLQEVVGVMTAATRTIRLSRSSASEQRMLSYHSTSKGMYEHWIENGVTHVITLVEKQGIIEACPIFFELTMYVQTAEASGQIPNTLIRHALRLSNPAEAERLLSAVDVSDTIRKQISEDLTQTVSIGDVLDIRYTENGAPVADQGLMLIFGRTRFWLLRPTKQDDELWLTILPGTGAALQDEVQKLIA